MRVREGSRTSCERTLRDKSSLFAEAEELEVERIALCWWRLKRAWGYENATNHVTLRDIAMRELVGQAEYCKTQEEEEKAVILQLQDAMKHIEMLRQRPARTFMFRISCSANWPP
jgi:hypothetical protein